MTKKKGLIIGIFAIIIAVVALVCALVFSSPKIVGKYELEAFVQNGEEQTEMANLLKTFGGGYTIELKSDKTGVLIMKGGDLDETMNFKWNGNKITFDDINDDDEDKKEPALPEETDFTYKDDTITITFDGEGMKFKRLAK